MKQRGEAFQPNSCEKHPISSPVGVCAYCLNDRLLQLQRSNLSLHRNSSSTIEFDNAEKASIFEEYDKHHHRRSNSSCVGEKKGNGFWRIKDFFGKMIKNNKGGEKGNFGFSEDQSEILVSDKVGVSSSSRFGFFSTAEDFDTDNLYGSNRMELCAIYENYCVPKRSACRVEEFSTIESDFIDLKLDLM